MSDIREDQIDLIDGKTQAEKREERTNQLVEIQEKYGDNLPYDQTRVVNETRFFMSKSAEAMLEAGKRLVLLKEHEPHGAFLKILDEDLGIPRRTASSMMKASVKYLNLSNKNGQALAHLGTTKLFDLMNQDDEDLEALAEGGTVAGLTLDEMDKLSTRELKKRLAEAKADQDAVRKVSADKDKKINDLSEKLEKAEARSKKEVEKLKLDESETDRLIKSYKLTLAEVTGDILASSSKLQQLFAKATTDALPEPFFQDFARELLSVRQNLELVAEQLPSDDGIVDTAWMDEA
ncbi:DUF3102 domain-containing protein [Ignatzschineria cameli]|uniref:DUF3102 domain-containing protein n=2 Tax=Ignatzschineria cameli TaxID=2182793 RepID=A0ABX5L0L8_9GAMM|nr:DUF3102 domain-containing protein [Ignatzschineria cameli]PWD92249.1 DUF3102 domain-containing protein [Ignatzschineria cameli]PWD93043.1 DUF3102 domain-containing protein [Ignatzschineria cameli]